MGRNNGKRARTPKRRASAHVPVNIFVGTECYDFRVVRGHLYVRGRPCGSYLDHTDRTLTVSDELSNEAFGRLFLSALDSMRRQYLALREAA